MQRWGWEEKQGTAKGRARGIVVQLRKLNTAFRGTPHSLVPKVLIQQGKKETHTKLGEKQSIMSNTGKTKKLLVSGCPGVQVSRCPGVRGEWVNG